MHNPTPQQQSIKDAISLRDSPSIMVSAYAGCAKSSTLEMAAPLSPEPQALALAFNKKIADELKTKLPSKFEIKTLNGLGHGAWARAIGKKLQLDDRKLGKLVSQLAKDNSMELSTEEWTTIRQLVSKAMQVGLVPNTSPQGTALIPDTIENWMNLAADNWLDTTEDGCKLARQVLQQNIKLAYEGVISFDDQIYMSALFGGQFPKFPLVFIDEAQDLSPLNHLQLRKCSYGRIVVVGDPKQAIYAFRGADHESMGKLSKLRTEWTSLPLTTTFRCPQAIVSRQQRHAPGFNAYATAPLGHFEVFDVEEGWTWDNIEQIVNDIPKPSPQIAILCRNNAPLLNMAFSLLRRGIGINMLGRDIGKNLEILSKKLFPADELTVLECQQRLLDWTESEIAKARLTDSESKIAGIEDRTLCLQAVFDNDHTIKTAGEFRRSLSKLFEQSGRVTLATAHRAKGLEWDLVLHLDPWRIPSKFAKKAAAQGDNRQLIQELNLLYVLETRTKHTLLNANLGDFK